MKTNEITLCGLAAVRAQFAADAGAIKRLFFDYPTAKRVGVMTKALAKAKKIYRCVEPAELEKIAGTVHHGGIVAIVAAPTLRSPLGAEIRTWAQHREPLLVLDRIGNAHNLGALVRTAAFFGVSKIVIPTDPAAALPGDAAHRVAEGGMAHVEILRVPALAPFLRTLAEAGFEVIGAATRGGRPDAPVAKDRPIALVLGNEEHGLAPDVLEACTRRVTIPGSGKVESLNVSVAGAVLMWELLARR